MPEPTPARQAPDPTRGYAAYVIQHGLKVNVASWHAWLRHCTREAAS